MKLTSINEDSQINKFSSQIPAQKTLQFPIQLRIMTDDEIREFHPKKLYEMSLRSIGEIPQLEELTLQGSFVGIYLAEEQKKELILTDKDIAGGGWLN